MYRGLGCSESDIVKMVSDDICVSNFNVSSFWRCDIWLANTYAGSFNFSLPYSDISLPQTTWYIPFLDLHEHPFNILGLKYSSPVTFVLNKCLQILLQIISYKLHISTHTSNEEIHWYKVEWNGIFKYLVLGLTAWFVFLWWLICYSTTIAKAHIFNSTLWNKPICICLLRGILLFIYIHIVANNPWWV